MLRESGLSLLEMLFVLAISALFIINTAYFIPRFYYLFYKLYQTEQIKLVMHQTIQPLMKDIRRAGFMLNNSPKKRDDAIMIDNKKGCVILSYDLLGAYQKSYTKKATQGTAKFMYRLKRNNIEISVTDNHHHDQRWRKLFDPNIIEIVAFTVKDHFQYAEVSLKGRSVKTSAISYTLRQVVKYENR